MGDEGEPARMGMVRFPFIVIASLAEHLVELAESNLS